MRAFVIAWGWLCVPAQADTAAAKTFFESGSVAFALGDYASAADDYERAFSEKPDPALLYNAAQAHRLAGNTRRALLLYHSYLSTPLFTLRPAARLVARRIDELEQALADEDTAVHAEPTASAWSEHEDPPKPAPPLVEDAGIPWGPVPFLALLPLGLLAFAVGARRRKRPAMPPSTLMSALADPPSPRPLERKTLILFEDEARAGIR